MDVVYPSHARSGSDFLKSGGFGELRIGQSGNQDEHIEIDSDDSDAGPQIELGLRNDVSIGGVSVGIGTGGKSMAGSTLPPREVGAVKSSASSHGRREQLAAGSQGSAGRSSQSIVVGRSLPQPTAGANVSPNGSGGSVSKVFKEDTSKRLVSKEIRTQLSIKSTGGQRQPSVGLSKRLSKSAVENDEDGVRSRERDGQMNLKRKPLEVEPLTPTPAKRTKMHGNPSDSSDMSGKGNRAEEARPRDMLLSTRNEDSPSKRKERFDGREEELRGKTLMTCGKSTEKRHRRLVLGDQTDDDTHDEPQWTGKQRSDRKWMELPGAKAAAEVSPKEDAYPFSAAKSGPTGSGKQVSEKQQLPLAGENGVAPFRCAFPLHAKKKVHLSVSGDKSHAGAGYGSYNADGSTRTTWIHCTKCKKIRKINADGISKRSTWCCEMNTFDPKYGSCSAPQEFNGYRKTVEAPADELEVLPQREARTEGQATLNETKDKDIDANNTARRNMVWVKLQVDGKELHWPGLQVIEFPSAIQKKTEEFIESNKLTVSPKVVRLFNPRIDLDEFQIVKRSSVQPFHQKRLSYKDSSSHPDFLVAVTVADKRYAQPDSLREGLSEPATGSNEGSKLNATEEAAGCHVEDVPHEEAESNELEFEDPETPGDDPQRSQPQTEKDVETLEDGVVNQVSVEEGVDDLSPEDGRGSGSSDGRDNRSPEAGNGSGLSDKRDDLQCSQSQADKERGTVEDEEVIQVPVEMEKIEDPPVARNDIDIIGGNNDLQCALSQVDDGRVELEDEEVLQGSVEQDEGVIFPTAEDIINSSNKRDDPRCSLSQSDQVRVVLKIETPVEQGNDDVEAAERTKGSEASGLEEVYGSGEKFVLDLEILPTKRLISYDDTTKMILFQDGATVSINTLSLGKQFNTSSSGRTLHECIHEVGRSVIREKFPKVARCSTGLKFAALDPSDSFAKRLRDTWLREYKDEPMPEFLKTRFVAGCILEERGEYVNWAHDLTRTIRLELKEIALKLRESLSPYVHKLIVQLLEKQVNQAPLPAFEAVLEEEPMESTEYDLYCQQCNNSGELLCCDGNDCRKTYHLKCLNPPLEEPPSGIFFCPRCSTEASKPSGVEVGSPSVVECSVNLHENDVSRQVPIGVAESATLVGETDLLKCSASVKSRMNSEVGIVTTEADGELPSNKDVGKCCVSSADMFVQTAMSSEGINLVANNLTKDAGHQLRRSNAYGTEHTVTKNTNVGDLCVSRIVADAAVGEELQIRNTPSLIVDSLQSKKPVLSEDPQKVHAVTGNASVGIGLSTRTASPLDLRSNGLQELRGECSNVQMGSSPSCIPRTDNGAIQLVTRDDRSGNRVESSILCGFTGSGLPEQKRSDSESELEEGEISHSEQASASDKAVDKVATKLTDNSPPLITQDISSGVEPPREEDEFPPSDDHNNICEGCEVGGELMYVTTSSLTSTPSSPLMLCDGKGCKVVYHKECLNPPLQIVPAGEWYCPECEKRRVEKIWSVRKACSVVRGKSDPKSSDATGSGNIQEDHPDKEDEVQDDIPVRAQFECSSQRPDGEVVVNEPGKTSGSCVNIANTNFKDDSLEYLVQWKSRSHAHDKWVSGKELEKIAPKELARFKKLLHEGQEKYDSEWAEPERVIQKRLTRATRRQPDPAVAKENTSSIQNAEIEWFVKWKGLGYEDCTWEPADAGVLATSRGIELINEYESWIDAAKQRASKESQEEAEKRVKLTIKDLDTQPEWMIRSELLPLQLEALNKLRRLWHSRMNGILVYEASQEKIVMTIMFFLSLVEDYRVARPILVVVPKSLIQNWEHELYQWAPKLYVVNYASKTEDARAIIRRTEFSSFSEPFKPQIVLTTFEVINCDMDYLKKVEWEALIIDEGRRQRLQKSYQKSYRPFSQIRSIFRLLLLSEPLKSNVEELIQFVNFLEPRKSVLTHGDDMTQVTELQRRLAGRVLQYIPENRLTEYWVPVEMTPVHLDQYYNLLVRHYPTLSRNHRDHQIQEVVTILRQSCNHPFLADPTLISIGKDLAPKERLDQDIEISGKMRLLHLMMPILKAENWRVVIFSQETKQLDILERYMTQSHGTDSYERVDSDLATKTKEAAIQRFNAEGSKRFVLLLKTGIHISFKNVQFLLLYDSDWNPANDMRALHKIHNEGEASSKPLPVLRLYTHLTVEESTLILFRDKQLPPTRANVNAKICQKLLTWGASKIFDRYDNTKSPTGSLYRPKGAKVCPKAKLKQVVYNPEVVQKLLEALLCQEEGSKHEGDELLEATLVPRDEPASLFAETDHPINMIVGDSGEAFWASSLKWRHDEWQAKEVNTLGKGQREKKRITYDEDAMATAVYTKAQFPEESERKRPRRRKASTEEEQEAVAGPSAQVSTQLLSPSPSLPTDSTSTQINTALHSNIPNTEQLQGNTDGSVLPRTEVLGPAHGPMNRGHASNRNPGSEVVRNPPKRTVEWFWEYLPSICAALELPEPVSKRVEELLKHCMHRIRRVRATHEIIAIELAAVWVAANQLNHAMDKMTCISKVEERLNLMAFDNPPQLVGRLYDKILEFCADFRPRSTPPAVVSTASQPLLVHVLTSSGNAAQNHPPRADSEPSSGNVSCQATAGEQPTSSLGENPLAGSQETCQQVEAELPSPVVLPSAPLSVQVSMRTDKAPAVEESHVAHTIDEPNVAEADTEVVLVGADPRLVPEEPLHTFIDQGRVIVPDPDGRVTSSASLLEQGLGWVLVGPTPAAPAGDSSSTAQFVRNLPSYGDSLQRGREAVSATSSAPLSEVPGIPTLEVLVESTSSPLTQTQVPPTQNIEPARQNEQAAPDTPARLKERSYQDMTFVIRGQTKESSVSKLQAHQKLEELKRKHDATRLQPVSDPSVVQGLHNLYNSQKKTLERRLHADFNALDARQRADRDKLRDLYSKLILSANGEGASLDVRKIELEIQRIKDYYSEFIQASLTPSPLQGPSLNQRAALRTMPSSRPSPSTTEASPTSTVQADGSSHVAQSSAPANSVEDQQRQRVGRSSSAAIPVAIPSLQQRVHSVQSSSQRQGRFLLPVTGMGLSNSQRLATEVVPTAAMQNPVVPPRGHLQRSNAAAHPVPTRNLQSGPAVTGRSTPAMVPVVPPVVGHMARPSAPTSMTSPVGNATGYVYPDVLLKEKEKLSKDLEKGKIAYESESQRIKAEYDKEAEILHKKYEALLVEGHSAFTKRQQQVQQNISKVEWNRLLVAALQFREELATHPGLSSQSPVQPVANQQTPQQIHGRPQSAGTAAASVPLHVSRVTTNTSNAGLGVTGITMHPPGTSSTRVSTAPVQHPPRYGMPAAPQQESPRYGMPLAPRNEQPRSSMSEAMAVLQASGNAGVAGNNSAAGISRAQLESDITPSPEPMDFDAVTGSPRPRTSRSSLPGVVAPMPPPFQDPILSIIRNSVPSLDPVVVPPIPPSSQAISGQQVDSGAHSEVMALLEVPVQPSPGHISSGPQEQPVANVAAASTMPKGLIYLSDGDE